METMVLDRTSSYVEPKIKSFYRGKTYGRTLYNEILLRQPLKVVEFGNGLGFTTSIIASALDAQGFGQLVSYDNSYNPRKWLRLFWNTWHGGRGKRVTLRYGNFDKWITNPEFFDLLYVDINNTGDTIRKLSRLTSGTVLFEGGSLARDEHMKGKPPINGSAQYTILDPTFPSLSRLD